MISIAIVDDHRLMRAGLANMIAGFKGYKVTIEAGNGLLFIESLKKNKPPSIVLLDINMPEMDGYQTAQWIRQNLPDTKIIALSMYENDYAIIQMLKNGCHGYLLKNSEPMLLYTAFNEIKKYGYFSNDMVSDKLIHYIGDESALKKQQDQVNQLTEKEKAFMGWVCTDKTYKEIADKMFISPRTVDTYRDHLFKKLDVKTRVGLALFAIKNNLAVI